MVPVKVLLGDGEASRMSMDKNWHTLDSLLLNFDGRLIFMEAL
jgi:hypothetical protein